MLQLEELRKRSSKDIESLQGQIEDLKVQNDSLEKSKKKLQGELEDIIVDLENTYENITIDLDSQRAKVRLVLLVNIRSHWVRPSDTNLNVASFAGFTPLDQNKNARLAEYSLPFFLGSETENLFL